MTFRAITYFTVFTFAALAGSTYAEQDICLIEPSRTLELSTPVSGLVEKVTVKRGDKISQGQLLIALASQPERAAAELANSNQISLHLCC